MAVRFRRNGQPDARAELRLTLSGLSDDATVAVAREFTYFLQLSNIAEDLHRHRLRSSNKRQAGPWGESAGAEQGWRRMASSLSRFRDDHRSKHGQQIAENLTIRMRSGQSPLVESAKKQRWHVRCSSFG